MFYNATTPLNHVANYNIWWAQRPEIAPFFCLFRQVIINSQIILPLQIRWRWDKQPHSYQKWDEPTNLRNPLQRLNRDELARTSISLIPFHSLPVYPLDPQIRILFSPHPPAVRQIPTVTFSRSLQHKRFYPPIHEDGPDEIRRQSMPTLHNTSNS